MESLANTVARRTFRELHGVVLSAGLMERTVKVRVPSLKWNKLLKKHFNNPQTYLVHDPNNSLRTGDVVSISPGFRTSQHKRHVVNHIIKPCGVPIGERPPIPSKEERETEREAKSAAKRERKALKKKVAMVETALERAERMVGKASKEIAARLKMGAVKRPSEELGR
ncbi:hypothetical protein QBC34DRAFT_399147 [Podospora aff. communis PSN243]|uniref:Uncharacterized protein n=1 Tax=Podospora aff. communis PSN243 TaxID=3040156 RepID=A0AAV9GUX1_9PEZI|nr:hypothetical protein QBC34DRAFT_399147 [Podospora aff. communis PSN243]